MKKSLIFIFVIMFSLSFLQNVSAALGISPARQDVDYKPGLELDYTFNVYSDSEVNIRLSAQGDFADLVRFNKEEFEGSGNFNVKIRLPDEVEKPGKHTIIIRAEESGDAGGEGAMGGRIAVQAPIFIMVPYPGKYAEISFLTNNANIGEPVNFAVEVASMGKEPIYATTNIEIYDSNNESVEVFILGTKQIMNQEKETFNKVWDTENQKAGDYEAIAVVYYGGVVARASKQIRLGRLYIGINNYTKEVEIGGIRPFKIDIESFWNDAIDNIYADVYIRKEEKNITSFRTAPYSLSPWSTLILTGYVDTEKFEVGEYDLEIVLHYGEKSTIVEGKLNFFKKDSYLIYVLVAIVIVLVILIIIAIIFIYRRKKSERKK